MYPSLEGVCAVGVHDMTSLPVLLLQHPTSKIYIQLSRVFPELKFTQLKLVTTRPTILSICKHLAGITFIVPLHLLIDVC